MKYTDTFVTAFYGILALVLIVYGIAMLGFYGYGIMPLWFGILYFLSALAVKKRRNWELPVSTFLFYTIFLSMLFSFQHHTLTYLQSDVEVSKNILVNSIGLLTLFVVVTRATTASITQDEILAALKDRVFFFALVWTLIVGYIIWQS